MYKGFLVAFCVSFLIACGSGSSGSGTEARDMPGTILGAWERGCTLIDRMELVYFVTFFTMKSLVFLEMKEITLWFSGKKS